MPLDYMRAIAQKAIISNRHVFNQYAQDSKSHRLIEFSIQYYNIPQSVQQLKFFTAGKPATSFLDRKTRMWQGVLRLSATEEKEEKGQLIRQNP